MEPELESYLQKSFQLPAQPASVRQALEERINDLIQKDFPRLVQLLYQTDIPEKKLKTLLRENPGTDAGALIADLVIARQAEKIKTRRMYKQRDNDMNEEERW